MINSDITNRWTGEVQLTAAIDCEENAKRSIKLGLSVKWAIKNEADLSNADLSNADLSGADLSKANLWGADLWGAYLWGADLWGADLSNVDLSNANLSKAYLSGADLSGADLSGADLSKANLWGANLWGAKNIISFGPVGRDGRIGYAVKHEKCIMVQLGCFWGTEEEAIDVINDKYGNGSSYASIVRAACDVLKDGDQND